MMTLEKRNKLARILDALSLAAVLQYAAFRFLQSTMFTFYYSDTYKMITMGLLIVFGGIRYLYILARKWKEKSTEERKKYILNCAVAWSLALPFFYVGFLHNYKLLIFLPICCMCLYDMQAEKVFKAFFITIAFFLMATVLCCLSGTVRNLTGTGNDGRVVAAYGIINTTDFASYFTFLLLTIWGGMKARGWKSSIIFAIAVAIISTLVYVLTDSRTVIDAGVIFVFLIICDCILENTKSKRIPILRGILNSLSVIAFPLIGLIVVFLVYSYSQQASWAIQLDQILSGRLKVTLDPYNTFGIHPFGNPIEIMHGRGGTLISYGWSSGYNYLDIAYSMLAIRYGWIITVIVTVLWVWMTVKSLKQGNLRIALMMTVMAVHAFSEARILDVNYNVLLMMPFCAFEQPREKISKERNIWVPVASGVVLVGIVYVCLSRMLSWLRTTFAINGWNCGTAAINSLLVCAGIIICLGAFWFYINKLVCGDKKPALAGIATLLIICAAGIILINSEIDRQLIVQAARLNEEENNIRRVQEVASQPVYAAEQEEIYNRRFGGFTSHLFSTEEMREGSILTDSDIEALGIISSGGLYTVISDKIGLYSYDSNVINALAAEGFDWTPYYSGRRNVNLYDVAHFNKLRMDANGLELVGPCRVITSNMETDQFGGIYEVEFRLSSPESFNNDRLATLEILGESAERQIRSLDLFYSDFKEGKCSKTISYRISNTPRVSFAINVNDKARMTIDEIGWKGAAANATEGVDINSEGKISMTTHVANNRFDMIQFQLYNMAGEHIGTFGEGTTSGSVSGEYVHNLSSGMYYLRLKGNTNRADEWLRRKLLLEQGSTIQYSYQVEELSENQIILNDVLVNNLAFINMMK